MWALERNHSKPQPNQSPMHNYFNALYRMYSVKYQFTTNSCAFNTSELAIYCANSNGDCVNDVYWKLPSWTAKRISHPCKKYSICSHVVMQDYLRLSFKWFLPEKILLCMDSLLHWIWKYGLFTRCAWVNDLRACIDMLRKLYGIDGAAI